MSHHHYRTRSSSISPQLAMQRVACRFLFDERGKKLVQNDEWETIYPSVASAARALRTQMDRKLLQVLETRRSLVARRKPPSHWSDLAPHSAVSVLTAQVEHLNHVEALLAAAMATADAVGAESQVQQAQGGGGQGNERMPDGGNAVAEPIPVVQPKRPTAAASLSNALQAVIAENHTILPLLRHCLATEEDLQRREAFARLAESKDATETGGSGGGNLLSSMHSLRNFSPTRTRNADQQATLHELVTELSDATSTIGRRVSSVRAAVDAWLWEGFGGEAVGERLSDFVDEAVAAIRHSDTGGKHSGDDSMGSTTRLERTHRTNQRELLSLPEELLVAAVEDELYCYDGMYKSLRSSLSDAEEDAIVDGQMRRSQGASQASLHVPALFQSNACAALDTPYAEAIATLKTIRLYRTPTRKLLAVKSASRKLLEAMRTVAIGNGERPEKIVVGGDDFIPMFVYVALQSSLPQLLSEVTFLRHCMARSMRHGELGYYATTLEFACEFIKNMASQCNAVVGAPPTHESFAESGGTVARARPLWLACPDDVFARSWAASGFVALEGDDPTGAPSFILTKRRIAINCDALSRRNALLAVCLEEGASGGGGDAGGDSRREEDRGASFTVPVTLIRIGHLSDAQWELVSTAIFSSRLGVALHTAKTVDGKTVLIPTASTAAGSTGWTALPKPRCGAALDVPALKRHEQELLRKHLLTLLGAWGRAGEDWPLSTAATTASDGQDVVLVERLQQCIALFGGPTQTGCAFDVSWVDGLCCWETAHAWQSVVQRFAPSTSQAMLSDPQNVEAAFNAASKVLAAAVKAVLASDKTTLACVTGHDMTLGALVDAVRRVQVAHQNERRDRRLEVLAHGRLDASTLKMLQVQILSG